MKRNRRKQQNSAGDVSDTVQGSSPHPRLRYAKPKPQKGKKNSEKKGRERKEGNKEGQERERGRRPEYGQGPTSIGMHGVPCPVVPGHTGSLPGTVGDCTGTHGESTGDCGRLPGFVLVFSFPFSGSISTVHNGTRYTTLRRSPFLL